MICNIYLAPMAGVSDAVFRKICSDFGTFSPFTEMISAKALYYDDKKTMSLFPLDYEGKMIVQLFGHDPDVMAQAAKKAEQFASEININMGCPMPKIVNNGDGSSLMGNPSLACEIVSSVKKATTLPVSIKFRKGISEESAPSFAKALEDSGADKLYIHGRTKEQLYSGKADLDTIKRVKESVSVPVIGNGDIFSVSDGINMLEKTNCDGIMIARGALGNPFIFREFDAYMNKNVLLPPATIEERINVCLKHLDLAIELKGSHRGILESRKHIAWYLKTIPGASSVRAEIFSSSDQTYVREKIMSLIK